MAKLYYYYSTMNAGKSTVLLQSSHNYQERGMDTELYMPAIDTRFGFGMIHSRIGLTASGCVFTPDFDIFVDVSKKLEAGRNIKCVLVDEAQFLAKSQVKQLTQIADSLHIPVLAYGLRTDFMGEPFEGSMYLLAWAEELQEIKAICHCGKKATMNVRIDDAGHVVKEGEQIQIGGNERYIATCRHHFNVGHLECPKPYQKPQSTKRVAEPEIAQN